MEFWTTILLSASIVSIASLGLFLQIRSGQLNVGMAPFVGVGGYVSGALCVSAGLQPWLSIPAAALAGFLFGAAFASITLRLHHWFFAVTTLTLTVAAVSTVGWFGFIGGAMGLMNIPLIESNWPIVVLFIGAFVFVLLLDRSTVGLQIRAVGDDEFLSETFGVKVRTLRIAVFGIGSALAAISGALHAHRFGIYQPSDLGFHQSLLLFIYVIVGGKRSVFGPVIGTFFLFAMPEIIKISAQTELIVFGLLMVAVSIWMPAGVAGAIGALYSRAVAAVRGSGRRAATSA